MATLVLGVIGSAVGGALLPSGLSILGATLSGAAIGGALGSLGGSFIDQALLGPLVAASGQTSVQRGPRLGDVKLSSSTEGTPLPRVYGRMRLPGLLIWATRFKKEVKVTRQTTGGQSGTAGSGGKNFGGPSVESQGQTVKTIESQILGLSTTLSALGLWATGDTTLMELVANLPVLLDGLGLAALGAKVDDTAGPARGAKSPKK